MEKVSCQLVFRQLEKAENQFLNIQNQHLDKYVDSSLDKSVINFSFSSDYINKSFSTLTKEDLQKNIQQGDLVE